MKALNGIEIDDRDIIAQIEDFLWVETKDSDVVPFKLNIKQNQLIDDVEVSKQPRRVIILKGRQFGFSTLLLAWLFIKCLLVPNTRAVVIAHDLDATKKLFRKIKFFITTLTIKPRLDKESEKEYSFPDTNSYFYIGTAGTRTFGRGDNITDLHCSEVAFWESSAIVMNGLLQAVGKTGNVFIETTANGIGGRGAYLHNLWKKSWKNAEAAWSAFFYKWTDFDEYELEPRPNFVLTDEEKKLVELHPELNDRKLAWRRWKISETEAESGMTPEMIFRQEYPFTPQEAFIATGNCIFDTDRLLDYETRKGTPYDDGSEIWGAKNLDYSVMGVDVAEGKTLESGQVVEGDSGESRSRRDSHAIQILDRNLEQVLQARLYCDMDELAEIIARFAERFNSFVAIEATGPGLAVLSHIKKMMPAGKLYHREVYDEKYKRTTKKLGWSTNKKTKPIMLNNMVEMAREHQVKINSAELISECQQTVRDENGDVDTNGKDLLMALALAIQAYKRKPPKGSKLTDEERSKKEKERAWRKKRLNRQLKRLRTNKQPYG